MRLHCRHFMSVKNRAMLPHSYFSIKWCINHNPYWLLWLRYFPNKTVEYWNSAGNYNTKTTHQYVISLPNHTIDNRKSIVQSNLVYWRHPLYCKVRNVYFYSSRWCKVRFWSLTTKFCCMQIVFSWVSRHIYLPSRLSRITSAQIPCTLLRSDSVFQCVSLFALIVHDFPMILHMNCQHTNP